jgi:3D (Asp-Asp-Asp) domain-containing protein
VSRGLKERLGLQWGDLVAIPGRGVWVVEDLMDAGVKGDSVDLMLPRQERPFREVAQVVFVRGDRS